MPFFDRISALPHLGVGVSTEYGAGDHPGVLDPLDLRRRQIADFLEVGVEVSKGLDRHARAWADAGGPSTYHFLDINLDDPADLDAAWLADVQSLIAALRPAWLCGDAGLWHLGRRDRGHMLLLPPLLIPEQLGPMADGIAALRDTTCLEVLPENPPGAAFVGPLHLLDFFGQLAERADTGLLIDAAHLAMFQRARGHAPLTAFDGFPLDRVIEVHVAGGRPLDHDGLGWVDDDHGPEVLDDTWQIVDHLLTAPNLRAVVVECERNPADVVAPLFADVRRRWGRA